MTTAATTAATAPLTDDERSTLVATRRDLHAHPELGYAEVRTADVVARRLRAAGYEARTGVGGTGVVADLAGRGPCTVMLRADLDGLPIQEENDVPYRSLEAGRMHACGHDGHVAALLAVAERLAAERGRLPGRVRFCFQPAEEGGNGALKMIEDGVLDGVDVAFGVHLWNQLDLGKVGLASGPVMAAVDSFDVTIEGVGGHGAAPHETRDPVVAACHVVTALQTIVSRNTHPLDSSVVTVGKVAAGEGFNVIPRLATLRGTCRSYTPETHEALPGHFRRVVEGVSAGLGCQARIDYQRLCPPTVNDAGTTDLAREVARAAAGAANVLAEGQGTRTMGGEDFSYYGRKVPACFAFVGSRNRARGLAHPHHSSRFDFDEDALPTSIALLEGFARRYLATRA